MDFFRDLFKDNRSSDNGYRLIGDIGLHIQRDYQSFNDIYVRKERGLIAASNRRFVSAQIEMGMPGLT